MSHNRFHYLEQLPEEIILTEMTPHLAKDDLVNISLISQTTHYLFKKPLKVARLLQFVIDADYIQAEKMVTENINLMFQHVLLKKDGEEEIISPLKFAFKVYDTYMWKMFLKKIENNPDNMKLFEQQMHEQKKHISLQPFFNAYNDHYTKCDFLRYLKTTLPDYQHDMEYLAAFESASELWLKIGLMQRDVLPRHMLAEFLRIDLLWINILNENRKFNTEMEPCPSIVLRYCHIAGECMENIKVLEKRNFSSLGTEFALRRVDYRYARDLRAFSSPCRKDDNLFRELYEKRMADYNQLVQTFTNKSGYQLRNS